MICGSAPAARRAGVGLALIRDLAEACRDNVERRCVGYGAASRRSPVDAQFAEAVDAYQIWAHRASTAAVERLIELGELSPETSLHDGTDILFFYLGPSAWDSLLGFGWSLDRARDFLAARACRALLRRD